jgi:hypothetical protein
MKKSLILCAALLACAFGFQSCDKVDNPGEATIDEATYDLQNLPFGLYIDKYAVDGVVTLPAGAEITVGEAIELTEPVTIVGDEKSHAKVVFAAENAGFIINGGLTLKNIDFDCAASTAPFIQLSKTPTVDPVTINAWGADYNLYLIEEPIAAINCTVTGLKSFFLTDNKIENNGAWFPTTILVDNCLVQLETPANNNNYAYFYTNNGGGFAKDMTVKNSTFYNTTDFGFRYFVRYGSFGITQAQEAFGWEETTLSYENSTFYNVCQNDGQWGNYNGLAGKTTSFWVMTNCIFWNCSTSGSVPRRFLHGKDYSKTPENKTFLNNTYMKKDGTFQDPQNYDTTGTNIEEDPHFADPANGDFHISGSKQATLGTGDPRWLP